VHNFGHNFLEEIKNLADAWGVLRFGYLPQETLIGIKSNSPRGLSVNRKSVLIKFLLINSRKLSKFAQIQLSFLNIHYVIIVNIKPLYSSYHGWFLYPAEGN
jgi:hypothetical protein